MAWGAHSVSSPEPLLAGLDRWIAPLEVWSARWIESGVPLWPLQLALAGALCAWLWRRPAPAAREPGPSLRAECLAWLALTAAFVVFGLYRVDVRPYPEVDEIAYYGAARMQVGELPRGPVMRFGMAGPLIYDYPRFQAQPVPLALTGAALAVGPSRLAALRIASLALTGAALLGCAALVRARWGGWAGIATLACGSGAPLLLANAQRAYYIAASEAHAVACFALLLHFERRRGAAAAAALGAAVGASLYFYQLSWFVPLFCGLCLLATPSLWRRRSTLREVAAGLAATCLVLVPALALRDGVRQVLAQTVNKLPAATAAKLTLALTARDQSAAEVEPLATQLSERDLVVRSNYFGARSAALYVHGAADAVEAAVAELGPHGWRKAPPAGGNTVAARAHAMLDQLYVGPTHEQLNTWVAGPALDPLFGVLLPVGLLLAWRRRDDVLSRYLGVWVAVALWLPGVVAEPLPRRSVLALPFACALAGSALLAGTPLVRGRAALALRVALLTLMPLSGAVFYYAGWLGEGDPQRERPPSLLELEDVVRGLPAAQPILLTSYVYGTAQTPRGGAVAPNMTELGLAAELTPIQPYPRPENIRRMSCRQDPPFTWITRDTEEQRSAFADALARDHFYRRFTNGSLLVVDVSGRLPEGCSHRR